MFFEINPKVSRLFLGRATGKATARISGVSCAHWGRVMQVSVEFLGRTRVLSRGRELALSRQSISFLAYLVLYRELDHPREVMIEHFWSSHEPARARSCLGTALSRLRKGLCIEGHDWLELSARGEPEFRCRHRSGTMSSPSRAGSGPRSRRHRACSNLRSWKIWSSHSPIIAAT
jgi:hypothetical protein